MKFDEKIMAVVVPPLEPLERQKWLLLVVPPGIDRRTEAAVDFRNPVAVVAGPLVMPLAVG